MNLRWLRLNMKLNELASAVSLPSFWSPLARNSSIFPVSCQKVCRAIRRPVLNRFPNQLIDRVEGDEFVIYAVAH